MSGIGEPKPERHPGRVVLVVLNCLSAVAVATLYLAASQLIRAFGVEPGQDIWANVPRGLAFIAVWAVLVQFTAVWLVALGLVDAVALAASLGTGAPWSFRRGAYLIILVLGVLAGVGAAYFLSFSGW